MHSDHISIETVDADGAVREAGEAAGIDRSAFLKAAGGSFVAGGVLLTGLVSPASAAHTISTQRRSKANDVRVLNYALTLEFLEAAFYRQAIANNAFADDRFRLFATTTSEHEDAHVKTLRAVLGTAAVKKPKFDFKDTVTDPAKFAATAQVLEDTGVAAYAGQGPNLLQRPVVRAALAIHSVEARHAAWIRFLNGGGEPGAPASAQPAPRAFDRPLGQRTVLRAVGETGFIVD